MSPRVAICVRSLPDLQDPMSVVDQIAEIERLCARTGGTITHTFTDEDMTGKTRAPRTAEQAWVSRPSAAWRCRLAIQRWSRPLTSTSPC